MLNHWVLMKQNQTKLKDYLKIDKKLFRKKDSKARLANPSKLTRKLKWKREYNFESLVVDMVESELKKFNFK